MNFRSSLGVKVDSTPGAQTALPEACFPRKLCMVPLSFSQGSWFDSLSAYWAHSAFPLGLPPSELVDPLLSTPMPLTPLKAEHCDSETQSLRSARRVEERDLGASTFGLAQTFLANTLSVSFKPESVLKIGTRDFVGVGRTCRASANAAVGVVGWSLQLCGAPG